MQNCWLNINREEVKKIQEKKNVLFKLSIGQSKMKTFFFCATKKIVAAHKFLLVRKRVGHCFLFCVPQNLITMYLLFIVRI